MRARIVIALCTAFGAVSVPAQQASSGPGTASQLSDPYLICMRQLAEDPNVGVIAKKLPLADMMHFSFEMLADESTATEEERRELTYWFDARQKCYQDGEAFHQKNFPPEIIQLAREGYDAVTEIGIELYKKKITFGEANKRIEHLRDETINKMIPIFKQYQADVAAEKAAAQERAERHQAYADAQAARDEQLRQQQEQLRQQRAALFLNYMHATQVQVPQLAPISPTHTTNCQTIGNNTSCITR